MRHLDAHAEALDHRSIPEAGVHENGAYPRPANQECASVNGSQRSRRTPPKEKGPIEGDPAQLQDINADRHGGNPST